MSNKQKLWHRKNIVFKDVCKLALVNYQDVEDGWDMGEGTGLYIT